MDPAAAGQTREARDTAGGRRESATSAIYGTLLVTAVIAALSEYPGADPLELLAVAVNTSVVFWLAHVYAEHVGERAGSTDPEDWLTFREVMRREWTMVGAAVLPVMTLALGVIGVLERMGAVRLALAAGVAQLFAGGYVAGSHVSPGRRGAVVVGLVNAGLGIGIVFLKALVH